MFVPFSVERQIIVAQKATPSAMPLTGGLRFFKHGAF